MSRPRPWVLVSGSPSKAHGLSPDADIGEAVFGTSWQRALSLALGYSHGTMSNVMSAKYEPSDELMGRLALYAADRKLPLIQRYRRFALALARITPVGMRQPEADLEDGPAPGRPL